MKFKHAAALTLLLTCSSAWAGDPPVQVMAAGSLRAAMTEMGQTFTAQTGTPVESRFSSAGLLHDRIEKGEMTDLFASADLAAPQALASEGKADPVVKFARNRMCVFVRPGLSVTSANLLDAFLDPKLILGTSTPVADPGGDYAWAILARAEEIRPGSKAILQAKAQRFLDRPNPAKAPEGKNALAWMLEQGQADLFIAYCSGGKALLDQLPGATQIEVPSNLTVTPELGLTRLRSSTNPAATKFAQFILSARGQQILASHGFLPP